MSILALVKVLHLIAFLSILSYSIKAQDQFADKGYYLVDSIALEELTEIDRLLLDSCLALYHKALHDTDRVNFIDAIVSESWNDKIWPKYNRWIYSFVQEKLKSDLPTPVEKKLKTSLASALSNIGYLYGQQGDFIKQADYCHLSLEIYEELGDKYGIASLLNNIGYVYRNQGDIANALDYYHRSLKIYEEIDNRSGIASSLNNIGYIYREQDDITNALLYYNRSLKLQEDLENPKGIANCLHNIAMISNQQGDFPKALEYYQRSLKIYQGMEDKHGIATSLNNIGFVYRDQDDLARALEYYYNSLEIYEELKYKNGIAPILANIAQVILDRQEDGKLELDKALEYANRSLEMARDLGSPDHMEHSAIMISKISKKLGNYQKALEMYELHIQMRDSIKNEETQKATIRQQTKYEFEKAQLVKEQEEKEAARIVAEETSRRDNLQYSVILIGILTLFGGVLALGFINVSERMAEGIIFFSFLILFEFLLVLADPYIEGWSGGAPGIKLLFNAGVAALIFPMHSLFERNLKRRLIKKPT